MTTISIEVAVDSIVLNLLGLFNSNEEFQTTVFPTPIHKQKLCLSGERLILLAGLAPALAIRLHNLPLLLLPHLHTNKMEDAPDPT